MKKISVIVQARMGSSRLPGKSLKKIGNDFIVEKVIKRLLLCKEVNDIIFAIPDSKKDDVLEDMLKKNNVKVSRGSEDDVLDRYYQAASSFNCDIIVRITADCPLIDPALIDAAVGFYKKNNYDYVSNSLERSYPRGFDCEVFSMKVLEISWRQAKNKHEREHVTPYIYLNPDKFNIYKITAPKELLRPDYRICVDTEEDFLLIKNIFDFFGQRDNMTAHEIVKLLDERPDLVSINRHVEQKKLV